MRRSRPTAGDFVRQSTRADFRYGNDHIAKEPCGSTTAAASMHRGRQADDGLKVPPQHAIQNVVPFHIPGRPRTEGASPAEAENALLMVPGNPARQATFEIGAFAGNRRQALKLGGAACQ